MQSGNGSLMRLAPAPMLLRLHPRLAVTVAGETSRTTHASRTTVDSCRYFAGLLVGAMNGAPKEKLIAKGGFVPTGLPDDFWTAMEPPLDPEVAEVVLGASHAEREPPSEAMPTTEGTICNSGYVVRTLEAALWAFGRSTGFEEGCLLVANLGDDSDTVAAIFGQLAGAFYGLSSIPAEWRDKLALKGLIESMAEELFDMSNRVDPCLPPAPPAPSTPLTSGTAGAIAGGAPATSPTTDPPRERVARFVVRPAADEIEGFNQDGGGFDGGDPAKDGGGRNKGRASGVYWGGGVAAHYQRLEDGYVAIKAKVNDQSYYTIDVFEEDIRAMFLEQPALGAAATSDGVGGARKETKLDGLGESRERHAGGDARGAKQIAETRKEALTAEFTARAARDRVKVERIILARGSGSVASKVWREGDLSFD